MLAWLTSRFQPQQRLESKYVRPKRKEDENVLFSDTRNTFYLRLYGVGHMVIDHTDNERGNPLPLHRLLFSRVILYASSHRQHNTYHGLCYAHEGSIRRPIAPRANALTTELQLAPAKKDLIPCASAFMSMYV